MELGIGLRLFKHFGVQHIGVGNSQCYVPITTLLEQLNDKIFIIGERKAY